MHPLDVFFHALWILAFLRRRKAIGGVLLVFFVQAFVKVLLSLMALTGVLIAWQRRYPSVPPPINEWTFHLLLVGLAMSFAASTVTAIAAIALLQTRSWHHAAYVRGGLGALALLAVGALLHHISVGNILELIFPFVFLPYFFFSKRVQTAFHKPELGKADRASWDA